MPCVDNVVVDGGRRVFVQVAGVRVKEPANEDAIKVDDKECDNRYTPFF